MKANLTDAGVLIVDAENSVEAFALQQWLRRARVKSVEVRYQHAGSFDGFDALNKAMREQHAEFSAWMVEKSPERM